MPANVLPRVAVSALFLLGVGVLLAPWAAPAGEGGKEKKAGTVALVNPAKDIHVLSDRKEELVNFFHRSRVIVGGLRLEDLKQALKAAKPREKVFLNYTSHNDDRNKEELFGSIVKLAPITGEAAQLLETQMKGPDGKERFSVTVILKRDAADAELYHAVGYTDRSSVCFFSRGERKAPDTFSPPDLRFQAEAKKK
jgi:hypothetical protein